MSSKPTLESAVPEDWLQLQELLGDSRLNLAAVVRPHDEPEWKYLRPANVRACALPSADVVADARDAEAGNAVWLRNAVDGFEEATLLERSGKTVKVKTRKGDELTAAEADVLEMNPSIMDCCEDMAALTHLNEAAVLHNISQRYKRNLIHTYSGLFCITVNPWRWLPIYSPKLVLMYKGQAMGNMPPHIYAISDVVYNNMLEGQEDQSILITGESGSGKTENTKKIIQYFTVVAAAGRPKAGEISLEQQIVESNPVLEAFGNAKSFHNDNSSRFGRFVRIYFSQNGKVAGAETESYLLEKSRVIGQACDERSYHIFYQLLSSATPADVKAEIRLAGHSYEYRYLCNGMPDIEGIDDAVEAQHTETALEILDIKGQERLDLYKMTAAVLLMGQMKFRPKSRHDDQASIQSMEEPQNLCHVLGIEVEPFINGLTQPVVLVGNERVKQGRNVERVTFSVAALAKAIYEKAFRWLVKRTNNSLAANKGNSSAFIGILDIAGFEIFEINSFEQLCINYTNERLQQFFNHQFFIREQDEYKTEGLTWEYIDFAMDLKPQIDLIEMPMGILSMLEEECMVPKGSDQGFSEKLQQRHFGKSAVFGRPKFGKGQTKGISHFSVIHYAGVVNYNVEGWLDKNKDPLNDNVVALFQKGENALLNEIWNFYGVAGFKAHTGKAQPAVGARRASTKSATFLTVSTVYKSQLVNLLSLLMATRPHFVRCIVPNMERVPGKFNGPLVLHQLQCNGVLEGIRICRQGYPNRLSYEDFRDRYRILATKEADWHEDSKTATQIICKQKQLRPDTDYQFGHTKIFCRVGVIGRLELMRNERLTYVFGGLQAQIRWHLVQRRLRMDDVEKEPLLIVQRNVRYWIELRQWSWFKLMLQLKPAARGAMESMRQTLARLEDENAQLKLQLDEALRKGEAAGKEAAKQVQDKLVEAERLLQEERAKREQDNEQTEQLKSTCAELQNQLDDQKKQNEQHEKELEDLRRRLDELQREIEADKERKTLAKEVSTVTDGDESAFESASEPAVDTAEVTKLQLIQQAIVADRAQLQESQSKLKEAEGLAAENDRLKAELEKLMQTVKAQEEQVQNLTKQQSAITDSSAQSCAILEDMFADLYAKLQSHLQSIDDVLCLDLDENEPAYAEKLEAMRADLLAAQAQGSKIKETLSSSQGGGSQIAKFDQLLGLAQSIQGKAIDKMAKSKKLAADLDKRDATIKKLEELLSSMNIPIADVLSGTYMPGMQISMAKAEPGSLVELKRQLDVVEDALLGSTDFYAEYTAASASRASSQDVAFAQSSVLLAEQRMSSQNFNSGTAMGQMSTSQSALMSAKMLDSKAISDEAVSTADMMKQLLTQAQKEALSAVSFLDQTMALLSTLSMPDDIMKGLLESMEKARQAAKTAAQLIEDAIKKLDLTPLAQTSQVQGQKLISSTAMMPKQQQPVSMVTTMEEVSEMQYQQIAMKMAPSAVVGGPLQAPVTLTSQTSAVLAGQAEQAQLQSSEISGRELNVKDLRHGSVVSQQIARAKAQKAKLSKSSGQGGSEEVQENVTLDVLKDQTYKLLELAKESQQLNRELGDLSNDQNRRIAELELMLKKTTSELAGYQNLLENEKQMQQSSLEALSMITSDLDGLRVGFAKLDMAPLFGKLKSSPVDESKERGMAFMTESQLLAAQIKEQADAINQLKSLTEKLVDRVRQSQEENDSLRKHAKSQKELLDQQGLALTSKDDRIRELEDLLKRMRKDLADRDESDRRSNVELEELRRRIKQQEQEIQYQQEQSNKSRQEAVQLQRALSENSQKELESVDEKKRFSMQLNETRDKLERSKVQLAEKQLEIDELRKQLSMQSDQRDRLMRTIRELEERVEQLEQELRQERLERKKLEMAMATLESDYAESQTKLAKIEKRLQAQITETEEKERQLKRAQDKLQKALADHDVQTGELRRRHALTVGELHDRVEEYHKTALKLECDNQRIKAAIFADANAATEGKRALTRSVSRTQPVGRPAEESDAALARQIDELEREKRELISDKRMMRQELDAYTKALQEEAGNSEALNRQLRAAQTDVHRLFRRLSTEQEDRSQMGRQVRQLQSEATLREVRQVEVYATREAQLDAERLRLLSREVRGSTSSARHGSWDSSIADGDSPVARGRTRTLQISGSSVRLSESRDLCQSDDSSLKKPDDPE